jgi:hypothetical protein
MTDTAENDDKIKRLSARVDRLYACLDYLEREVAEIKMVLKQPRGAVARVMTEESLQVRDPDILAQEQRTGMRGVTPFTDTGA